MISSHYIIRFLKKKRQEDGEKYQQFEDDKTFKCIEQQLNRMSILYLVFAFSDLILLIIGNVIDHQEDYVDFYCVDDWYLLYFKTPSVIFVLFHNLFFCLFSI